MKCDLQHKDQPKRRGLAFSYRVCSVLYSQGVQRYLLYSSKCTILSRNTCALLVMSGMWMPFESNHPPRHSCRPSTPPHGNSTLQSVAPHQDNDPTKTGMQQKDQKAQSVDLSAKEFNLTDLRHVRSGPIDGGLRCPKDPLLQDSLLDRTHPLSLHLHLVFFFCLFESQSRIGLLAGPNFNPKASANHLFLQIGCLNCSLICKLFLCLMSTFLLVAET